MAMKIFTMKILANATAAAPKNVFCIQGRVNEKEREFLCNHPKCSSEKNYALALQHKATHTNINYKKRKERKNSQFMANVLKFSEFNELIATSTMIVV